MKEFILYYVSKYYPLAPGAFKRVPAPSKKWIRNNWHSIIDTDEYSIKKIDEVK